MNIFDDYSAEEMRDIWRDDTNAWPEDFCKYINNELAYDLLDRWLESHSDEEYREEAREIIENLTYGYWDDEGNELLEFDELTENNGQKRLF